MPTGRMNANLTLYMVDKDGTRHEIGRLNDKIMDVTFALNGIAQSAHDCAISLHDFEEVQLTGHFSDKTKERFKKHLKAYHIYRHTKSRRIKKKNAKKLDPTILLLGGIKL
jgi:hypothetical protein